MLASRAILYPFSPDHVGFFNRLVTMYETLYMIQRPKPIQGLETQWFPASKDVQDTEVIKQDVGVCLLGERWNFACRPPGKGDNHQGKVLSRNFRQTEATTGLQTSRQAFERNLDSSRQCYSSQRAHYASENGRPSLCKF
jgi:hypothetical protein